MKSATNSVVSLNWSHLCRVFLEEPATPSKIRGLCWNYVATAALNASDLIQAAVLISRDERGKDKQSWPEFLNKYPTFISEHGNANNAIKASQRITRSRIT